MNNSGDTRQENDEDELRHYVNERPGLLLKMLEVAENCWHEERPASREHAGTYREPRPVTKTVISCNWPLPARG